MNVKFFEGASFENGATGRAQRGFSWSNGDTSRSFIVEKTGCLQVFVDVSPTVVVAVG